ncbi:unnamed protein product [Arabis nemorensis]|uniref:Uncharacterized protein n=1 Tax=Arabis nemorensis TaxID=586526 RepID=A0A565ASD7_9BRAS|nr:unnamed protein product [Arabis nemorensis]
MKKKKMPSEDAKAVKKEEAEEDDKSLSSLIGKKPTNANSGISLRKLKKEEIDDNKPNKSSLSGSLLNPVKKEEIDEKPVSSAGVSKGLGGQFQTTAGRSVPLLKPFKDWAFLLYSYVKEAFHDEPAKFKEFIKVLEDYKFHRVDEASTFARVVELLKDHVDLLHAFSVLFPEANITVPLEAYQGLGRFQTIIGTSVPRKNKAALLYMAKVKEAFHDEPAKYIEFLKVLEDVRARRFDGASAIAKVEEFMKEHDDLLRAFSVLFPEANINVPPKAKQQIAPDDHKRKRADQSDGADFMNKRKV